MGIRPFPQVQNFTLKEFHNLKEFLNVIKSVRASFTHTDVHFASGENSSAGMLEGAATNKQK